MARPDGDRAECHICGDTFHKVAAHANQTHDVTELEYRALFGLNRTQTMASASHEAHMRQKTRERGGADSIAHDGPPQGFTPEQWLDYAQQRRHDDDLRRSALGLPARWRGIGYALSSETIGTIVRARGLVFLSEDERADIVSLSEQGATAAELADRFGVSVRTIGRIRAAYGVAKERRRAQPRSDTVVRSRRVILRVTVSCVVCACRFMKPYYSSAKTCSRPCRAAAIGRSHAGRARPDVWRQRISEGLHRHHDRRRAEG
jgi:hypothetical protein